MAIINDINKEMQKLDEKDIIFTKLICNEETFRKLKTHQFLVSYGKVHNVYGLSVKINNKIKGFKIK